jgi:hypothetical protein
VHVEQQAQGAIVIVDRGEKCLGWIETPSAGKSAQKR